MRETNDFMNPKVNYYILFWSKIRPMIKLHHIVGGNGTRKPASRLVDTGDVLGYNEVALVNDRLVLV
jgi:hypothetical protein